MHLGIEQEIVMVDFVLFFVVIVGRRGRGGRLRGGRLRGG
jgi:hypothetical protein